MSTTAPEETIEPNRTGPREEALAALEYAFARETACSLYEAGAAVRTLLGVALHGTLDHRLADIAAPVLLGTMQRPPGLLGSVQYMANRILLQGTGHFLAAFRTDGSVLSLRVCQSEQT